MSPPPYLVFIEDPERPYYKVEKTLTKIGRSSKNDVTLRDSSVSKLHCVLVREKACVKLYDLFSENGTWVGKNKAQGKVLEDGDLIRLGALHLTFMVETDKTKEEDYKSNTLFPLTPATSVTLATPVTPVIKDAGAFSAEEIKAPSIDQDLIDMGREKTISEEEPRVPTDTHIDRPSSPWEKDFPEELNKEKSENLSIDSHYLTPQVFPKKAILFFGLGVTCALLLGELFSLSGGASLQESQKKWEKQKDTFISQVNDLERKLLSDKKKIASLENSPKDNWKERWQEAEGDLEEAQTRNEMLSQEMERLESLNEVLKKILQSSMENSSREKEAESIEEVVVPEKENVKLESEENMEEFKTSSVEKEVFDSKVVSETELSDKEIHDLVERMKKVIENYASPYIKASSLDPMKSRLSSDSRGVAAKGMRNVFRYTQDLSNDLVENLSFLKKQKDRILLTAKVKRRQLTKSDQKESYQRLLELTHKKILIREEQKKRLRVLKNAILSTYPRFSSSSGLEELTKSFEQNFNQEEQQVVLKILISLQIRAAIPALIKTLKTKDKLWKKTVQEALVQITGENPGENYLDWQQWQKNQK